MHNCKNHYHYAYYNRASTLVCQPKWKCNRMPGFRYDLYNFRDKFYQLYVVSLSLGSRQRQWKQYICNSKLGIWLVGNSYTKYKWDKFDL